MIVFFGILCYALLALFVVIISISIIRDHPISEIKCLIEEIEY